MWMWVVKKMGIRCWILTDYIIGECFPCVDQTVPNAYCIRGYNLEMNLERIPVFSFCFVLVLIR